MAAATPSTSPRPWVRKRAIIDQLELDFAYEAARFAREYDENLFAYPSPYSWVRENCHMAGGAAVNAVTVGDYAARLALSVTALTAQHIGFAHLSLIASTAAAVGDSPAALARFDEQRLLSKAQTVPLRRFRIECAHVRHAADREAFLAAQVEDRQWSSLRVRTLTGGGLEVTGYLDAEGGAVVRTALEPLAARRGRDDDRGRERRLACDATITRVLLDPRTATVDVGRSERVVPGATRRAFNVRDKGCRWPGCDRSPSWTAAHHLLHWVNGGATDLANLVLLCNHHHWAVHEGGWQLVAGKNGSVSPLPPRALARSPN